jgi:integrase/recombinase XerD
MSEKPISPLRQRMLEDMNMRRFVPDTQREYIRAVKKLASFFGRCPDTATAEELRAFQLAGLFAGPAPTSTGFTIPNSANSPHPALVDARGPGDGVPASR